MQLYYYSSINTHQSSTHPVPKPKEEEMKPASSGAMRGKTARACDSCLKKRARWFCAADDAFLCQACDSSVHSANQLARRHFRVRINNNNDDDSSTTQCLSTQAWHQGFMRKARTPRSKNKKWVKEEEKVLMMNPPPPLQLLVPQIEEEGNNNDTKNNNNGDDEEEQEDFLYRVPVLSLSGDMDNNGNLVTGFLDSDANEDLVEFSADVERLLAAEEGDLYHQNPVKIKDEEEEGKDVLDFYLGPDFEESLMGWDFDYDSPKMMEEKKPPADNNSMVETAAGNLMMMSDIETKEEMRRNISLRLNHEAVMAAWANQGSPWTTGSRPQLNPNDYWLHFVGTNRNNCEEYGGMRGQTGCSDRGGREARVSRYREKKRTRLFSKKIRYEVRKLNAEKRPRMKGRFVKTTTTASIVGPSYLSNS